MSSSEYSEFISRSHIINKKNDDWEVKQILSLIVYIIIVIIKNVGKKVINIKKVNLELISF